MRATALFILLALVGLSYQQDTNINTNINVCPASVTAVNTACLSKNFGYIRLDDLSLPNFCAMGFTFTQCLDGSCIDTDTSDALRIVVPQLFRPNICPICSDIPFILESSRKVCTAFGVNHVIPFDRQPYFCANSAPTNGTVLLSTNFITLRALTSVTDTGFTGVRFDYHGCVVFSRTWNVKETWTAETVPTAGWFPHTIRITQNETKVSISLPALNTDILFTKNGNAMAVSIGYGARSSTSDAGVCVDASPCIAETNFIMPTPTTKPCTSIPAIFATGCQFDVTSMNGSNWGQNAYDAATIDATLKALQGNGTILQELDFRRRGLPVVLTVVPTAAFVGLYIGVYFWRRRVIRRRVETMEFTASKGCCNSSWRRGFGNRTVVMINAQIVRENLTKKPIRAIWCWLVFCLNAHALGLVYSFTGLVLLSMFCGLWIFLYIALNLETIAYGNSRFSVAAGIIYKIIMSLVLAQQAGIGIIGLVAYEYYLYEVQFWWGIAVLIFMFIGAFWMMIAALDLTLAARYLTKGSPVPKQQSPESMLIAMQEVNNNRGARRNELLNILTNNQNHVVNVQQQQHVIPNAIQIAQPQAAVQVSDHVIPPPQAHVIQGQPAMNMQVSDNVIPPPQAHVMQPQPGMYGNGVVSPPDNNPYIQPAPANMVPGYGSVNIAANTDQNDPCFRVAKRTIKMAAVDLDPTREQQINQTLIEMLQSMNVSHTLRGEDGEAASLRNDLAKNLAEEVKMYRNDSLDELAYGLKEAILLWKDEHKLT